MEEIQMRLTWKALAVGVLLASASTTSFAVPTCNSSTDWVSLGPPGVKYLSNWFSSAGTYNDCYTFSLGANADSFGGVVELDPWFNTLDIDVTSVSLLLNGSSIGEDQSPLNFAFGDLDQGGIYTLVVNSLVTADPSGLWNAPAGYIGLIGAMPSAPAPTSVPEPTTLTLLGLGLVTAAVVRRRRVR
jgi:hypothetical protein